MTKKTLSLFFGASLLVAPSLLNADSYYLQSNNGAGTTWNTLTNWYASPTDNLAAQPVTMTGHDFFLNGKLARADTDLTFKGESLTNDIAAGVVQVQRTGVTLGTFNVTAQGSVALNSATAAYAFNVTNLALGSTLNLRGPGSTGSLTFNVANLTGAGALVIGGGNGGSSPANTSVVNLSVANAAAFTGSVSAIRGNLVFAAPSDFSLATLSLDANGDGVGIFGVNLANDVTFGSVTGTNFANSFEFLSAGNYTAAQLNTLTDTTLFSGLGTLTVIPEPGAVSLFAGLGALMMLLIRRSRS